MSTTADRPSVVKQDLANVIHPIVPHKQLEEHQLVIVSGKDSTVVDADGHEYLDGMGSPRRFWLVDDHAALDLALQHQIEALVELGER